MPHNPNVLHAPVDSTVNTHSAAQIERRRTFYRESLATQISWLKSLEVTQITEKLTARCTKALLKTFYGYIPDMPEHFSLTTDAEKNNCRLLIVEILEWFSPTFFADAALFAEYYGLNMVDIRATSKTIALRYNLDESSVSRRVRLMQERIRGRYERDAAFRQRVDAVVVKRDTTR